MISAKDFCRNHQTPCKGLPAGRNHHLQVVYNCALFKNRVLAPVRLLCFLSVLNQHIQLLLNRFAVEDESQKLHHIIISQDGQLSQKGFQHSGTSAKAVGSLDSGQSLDLVFQSLFFVLGCSQLFLSDIFLLLQFFQLLIRQSHHPLLTQTMSYPRASASSTASP